MRELYAQSDQEVIRRVGLVAMIYLAFMRTSGYYFLIVGVISCAVLIPTYSKGEPSDKYTEIDGYAGKYTLLRALGDTEKQWTFFILSMALVVVN
jgi:hypothetical protein